MKNITIFYLILLIFLIIIAINSCVNHSCYLDPFNNINDFNINLKLDTNQKKRKIIVPLYAPWRMYYPYEEVYPYILPFQYQNSPFYPFFEQYNIYQNFQEL